MNYILVIICTLFVFLGMYIGKKKDLKYFSINSLFGLFMVNSIINIFNCYNILYKNFHSTTLLYVVLCIIIGFIVMIIASDKYDKTDDISFTLFSIFNCFLLCNMKLNILSIIINTIYYILIGIYIKDSNSYINVFIGGIIGIIISFISSWMIGYFFSIIVGGIIYFLYTIYNVVVRNKDRYACAGLITGILVAILGSVL